MKKLFFTSITMLFFIWSINAQTTVSNNTSLNVPDNGNVATSTIDINNSAEYVSDINLWINLSGKAGDIKVVLKSPQGTEVVIIDRPGYPGHNQWLRWW